MATSDQSTEYFLYVHGFLSRRILGFASSDSGAITPLPGSVSCGLFAWGQQPTPDGRFLVAGSKFPRRLYSFRIADDGTLSTAGPAVALPAVPVDMAFTPDGRHGFVVLGVRKSAVQNFTISEDGTLELTGAPVPFGGKGDSIPSISVSPDGSQLYVGNYFPKQILRLPIGADGTVSSIAQRIATGVAPIYPTPTPDGKHVYIANERERSVSGYSVGEDGALQTVPGSPFRCGGLPHVASVTPDSRFIYVPNMGDTYISSYAIQPDGSLRELAPGWFGEDKPESTVMSPSGKVVWGFGNGRKRRGKIVLRRLRIQDDGTLLADPAGVFPTDLLAADGRTLSLVPRR